MIDEIKTKRRWQNLLYKKCPNCDSRLEDRNLYFICPNPNPQDSLKNCFFIKKTRAAELLLDPKHPANICLNSHERLTLDEKMKELCD